ncbi:MAG: hypothetical protein GY755_23295 [Chloroflexi bacterium]|nr:hypothetical protein [Chloroflexota bacterium]
MSIEGIDSLLVACNDFRADAVMVMFVTRSRKTLLFKIDYDYFPPLKCSFMCCSRKNSDRFLLVVAFGLPQAVVDFHSCRRLFSIKHKKSSDQMAPMPPESLYCQKRNRSAVILFQLCCCKKHGCINYEFEWALPTNTFTQAALKALLCFSFQQSCAKEGSAEAKAMQREIARLCRSK